MDILSHPATWWFAAGILLAIAEMTTLTVVMLFFSIAALVTAGIALLFPSLWGVQIAAFSVVSILSLVFLRKTFKRIFSGTRGGPTVESANDGDEFVGRKAVARVPFQKGQGRIEFRGTEWSAVIEEGEVRPGDDVTIVRREGLTLIVRKNDPAK